MNKETLQKLLELDMPGDLLKQVLAIVNAEGPSKAALRKRRERERKKGALCHDGVTVTRQNEELSRDISDESHGNVLPAPPSLPLLSPSLSSPAPSPISPPIIPLSSSPPLPGLGVEASQEPEPSKPWTPTPEQTTVGQYFNRRPTTRWTDKELRAWKSIQPIDPADLELMTWYYTKSGHKFLRQDLQTLLNNWTGELDRALKAKKDAAPRTPAKIDYNAWTPRRSCL